MSAREINLITYVFCSFFIFQSPIFSTYILHQALLSIESMLHIFYIFSFSDSQNHVKSECKHMNKKKVLLHFQI
jgi:hypothetical protein